MIGTSFAHYRITARLGAGGMGEVFRATDEKLGRDVAVKVLPEGFAGDPERLSRMQREAQLLATLNHPNVAAIYGLEEQQGRPCLILELVEGEDLSERIERGPIPVDETIAIARQIAEALEAAHEKGIVHRDLKPANVKLTPQGQVKVLDFGLAKAVLPELADGSGSFHDLSQSPTMARSGTVAGVILGTASYMSPEQARGKAVDRRADLWAFGVVLFEMLTGSRLYTGETATDVIAGVLTREPDWALLPAAVPEAVRALLRRCLTRDPKQRVQCAGDLRLDLASAASAGPTTEGAAATDGDRNRRLLTGAAVALALSTLTLGALLLRGREQPRVVRAAIEPPAGTAFHLVAINPGPVAVSPDGSRLAFSARNEAGTVSLYIRSLDAPQAQLVGSTEGAQYPFWSPDSRFVGFFAQSKLRKVEVAGGTPVTLCDADDGKGGTWNREGAIVFAPSADSGLSRVSEEGGEPESLTVLGPDDSHRQPHFLPNGKRFLYLARTADSGGEGHEIRVGSLDAPQGDHPVVLRSAAAAEFAAGHLIFLRESTLLARPFDPETLSFRGDAFPLAENVVLVSMGAARAVFSASEGGVLAYQTGTNQSDSLLRWSAADGSPGETIGEPARYLAIALDPQGREAVAEIVDGETGVGDLWLVDLERGLRTRFTFGARNESSPAWSHDRTRVAFASNEAQRSGIYAQAVAGSAEPELLLATEASVSPESFMPDGSLLAYTQRSDETQFDIWMLPLDGEAKPYPFLQTKFGEAAASFSPDGRWIAYHSNESGRWEAYVTPFPGPGRKWQISPNGGGFPTWQPDMTAILYQKLEGGLVAVSLAARGDDLAIGASREIPGVAGVASGNRTFAITPDGQRFLSIAAGERALSSPIQVVVNWTQELKRR